MKQFKSVGQAQQFLRFAARPVDAQSEIATPFARREFPTILGLRVRTLRVTSTRQHLGGWRSHCKAGLTRLPERSNVCAFHIPTLLRARCPSGSGFLVNGLNVDPRRNYPVSSTRHTRINNATERELEHDIARCEAQLRRFHEVYAAQTGFG